MYMPITSLNLKLILFQVNLFIIFYFVGGEKEVF